MKFIINARDGRSLLEGLSAWCCPSICCDMGDEVWTIIAELSSVHCIRGMGAPHWPRRKWMLQLAMTRIVSANGIGESREPNP